MGFDKAKFLVRFVSEAREHIISLREGLLALEKRPDDTDSLNSVFRMAHTIKGASKMMKLTPISSVAHKLEDVMDALRQGKICLGQDLSDLLFRGVAEIDRMLDETSAGKEVAEISAEFCEKLEAAAKGESDHNEIALPPIPDPTPVPSPERREEAPPPAPAPPPSSSLETIRLRSDKLDELIKLMGEIISGHSRSKQRLSDIKKIERLAKQHAELISDVEHTEKEEILQIAKSLHLAMKKLAADFKEDVNIQGLLSGELQDKSLKMRMLPLSTIFDVFRMALRDFSKSSGKKVDFIIHGGETELDKKIIEKIGDSLIHLIRNCVDHGIEMPDERIKLGKPAVGKIVLSAGYEGGNAVIELSDDGSGIPVKKLREKALKKKISDEAAIADMADADIINMIFMPGFSSSDIITDVSGRGVGMDVVRKNIIEDLKGAIRITTKDGQGTGFHIRLPLTMAIIHVLFVRVSETTFAVPAHFISEIVRMPEDNLIQVMDKKALRLREQIVPILSLKDMLRLPHPAQKHSSDNNLLILIGALGNEKIGMMIDELLSEEDVVIKSLPALMKNIQAVSGVVISGKNELFNVLHIPKIIETAKETNARIKIQPENAQEPETEKQIRILIADDSVTTREIEKSILESYGYSVDIAGDGMEGLEMAKNLNYDLIITDAEMPRLDGFSLIRQLRNEQGYAHTPIILVTSLDKEEDKKRGIEAGANAYIVKGAFDQSALLDSVQHLAG